MPAESFLTLQPSGLLAELRIETLADRVDGPHTGVTLLIDAQPQSHVFPEHPARLLYDYVQRIAILIDLVAPPGDAIRALHLGAGALTLPRYVAATRPLSRQFVVESEGNLVDFVTGAIPLQPGAAVQVHTEDARTGLSWAAAHAPFDVIVVDVYSGADTPAHLRTVEFFTQVVRLLAPEGIVAVNVADDAGLPIARRQAATVASAIDTVSLSRADVTARATGSVLVLGPADLIAGAAEGNAVIVGSTSDGLLRWSQALRAAGPHPAGLVATGFDEGDGGTFAPFVGDARAVTDAERLP